MLIAWGERGAAGGELPMALVTGAGAARVVAAAITTESGELDSTIGSATGDSEATT